MWISDGPSSTPLSHLKFAHLSILLHSVSFFSKLYVMSLTQKLSYEPFSAKIPLLQDDIHPVSIDYNAFHALAAS